MTVRLLHRSMSLMVALVLFGGHTFAQAQFYRYRCPDGTMVISDKVVEGCELVRVFVPPELRSAEEKDRLHRLHKEPAVQCWIDAATVAKVYDWLYNERNDPAIFVTKSGIHITLEFIADKAGYKVLFEVGDFVYEVSLVLLRDWLAEKRKTGIFCYELQ